MIRNKLTTGKNYPPRISNLYRLLFLTSTVTPSVLPYYGSPELRKDEYVKAIRFYLENTPYRILVVDNSGYDFNKDFPREDRIEALSYKEDNPTDKGKGYGEMLLMQYGFRYSQFLKEANQIVKITGRHIIKNINQQLRLCNDIAALYVDATMQLDFARSYFFVSPKSLYERYLFPRIEELDDPQGIYLEHLLGRSIRKWLRDKGEYHQFLLPVHIIGRGGTAASQYKSPSIDRYVSIAAKFFLFELKKIMIRRW